MAGEFVISLDFELLWGMRDHADRSSYGKNVLGGREAIPRILELFEKNGIAATWATIGFLFCESKEELLASLPEPDLRPSYTNKALSTYSYMDEVGESEKTDPFYYAPSIIKRILEIPGQEIGTHTLSHYYCLEDGQSDREFEADLVAAQGLADKFGIRYKSIVFPRNQYGQRHVELCRRHGITSFRGNPTTWAYRPAKGSAQTPLRRALRLADAHSGVLGHQTYAPSTDAVRNVPASQFLRPKGGMLGHFHPLHIRTIKAGMKRAARRGHGYHLWWHPHNFGVNTEENLAALKSLTEHFSVLHHRYGMASRSMGTAH